MHRYRQFAALALAAALGAMDAPATAQCLPEWTAVQAQNFGLGQNALAAVEWDDGGGPALYIGGEFSGMGGTFSSGVVKYDGHTFTNLQCGFPFGSVSSLRVWDPDGNGPQHSVLVACGSFTIANGFFFTEVGNIATWDGSNWSALGDPYALVNPNPAGQCCAGSVADIAVFDDGSGPKLYACGSFELPSGHRNLARWNGSAWEGVGTTYALGGYMTRMLAHDDGNGSKLYLAGINLDLFSGNVAASFLVRWTGSVFEPVGALPATPRVIADLAAFDPDGAGPSRSLLCIAGRYGPLSNAQLDLYTWDGSDWTQRTVPSNEPGEASDYYRGLTTLCVHDDGSGPSLYMGTQQANYGTDPTSSFFYKAKRWNGAAFSSVAASLTPNTAVDTSTVPSRMTTFSLGGPERLCITYHDFGLNMLQQYTGTAWTTLPESTGPAGTIKVSDAVMWDDDGAGPHVAVLYCVGEFPWGNAARFDGQSFAALPAFPASTLPLLDTDRMACAIFDDGSGAAFYASATKGSVVDGSAHSLGTTVYKLTGGAWVAVGTEGGFHAVNVNNPDVNDDSVLSLCAFNDGTGSKLYATGRFTSIGGVTVHHVARFNGVAWEPVGAAGPSAGLASTPEDASLGTYIPRGVQLLTFDDGSGLELYLAGQFTRIGGVRAGGIARWNGAAWAAHGTDLPQLRVSTVRLAVHDEGAGPRLWASGLAIGGDLNAFAPHVHRWSGTQWDELSGGISSGASGATLLGSLDNGGGRGLYLSCADPEVGLTRIFQYSAGAWTAVPQAVCYGLGDGRAPAFEFNTPFRRGVLINTGFGMAGEPLLCGFGIDMQMSATMSIWGCPVAPPACPADFNGMGGVTIDDLFLYINAYFMSAPAADFNGVGGVTIDDLFLYINAYFVGC